MLLLDDTLHPSGFSSINCLVAAGLLGTGVLDNVVLKGN